MAALRRRQEYNEQGIQYKQQSIYGDSLLLGKEEEMMRCAFLNINGLPQRINTQKEQQLHKLITDYDLDITGVAEVNLHWHKVKRTES